MFKSNVLKNYIKSSGELEIYTFFIELGINNIIKRNGIFIFITTNTIYYLEKFSEIRKKIFLGNTIISLVELEKKVFADAPDIVPAIYCLVKKYTPKNTIELYKSNKTNSIYDLIHFKDFKINKILQESLTFST